MSVLCPYSAQWDEGEDIFGHYRPNTIKTKYKHNINKIRTTHGQHTNTYGHYTNNMQATYGRNANTIRSERTQNTCKIWTTYIYNMQTKQLLGTTYKQHIDDTHTKYGQHTHNMQTTCKQHTDTLQIKYRQHKENMNTQ